MPKPKLYTESKVVKLTKQQSNTLKKLESYNIRVCQFIRDAISEKLKRDGHEITRKKKYCPFSNNTIEL